MHTNSELGQEERRSVDRRISIVEDKVNELGRKVDTNNLELGHINKMIDAKFSTVEKGQDLLLTKLDAVRTQLDHSMSEASKSGAGRELLRDLSDLRRAHAESLVSIRSDFAREVQILTAENGTLKLRVADMERREDHLESERDRLQGALTLLKQWNIGSILVAIGFVILKYAKVIP